MQAEITNFLNKKGITDEFIREIVTNFITVHTNLYGSVIPFNELLSRLDMNLNSIILIPPEKAANDIQTSKTIAEYQGFDKGNIIIYFSKEDLNNIQLRKHFISILLHELTHCAYNKKENDIYESETQIFGTYESLLNGKTLLTKGHNIYLEAIVNYISCRIFGETNELYLAETANIAKLASIVNEKELIRSAFYSDEKAFQACFQSLSPSAYEYFTEGMKWLNLRDEIGFKKGTEIMNNFFMGNIPSLTPSKRFKEIEKASIQEDNQTLRRGFINMFLLALILIILIIVVIVITIAIKQ